MEAHLLSPDATSVRIQEGTARLIDDATGKSDTYLTLLPESVCFTREGYDRLVGVTTRLQEDLNGIRQRVKDYETAVVPPLPAPPKSSEGWSRGDVFLMGVVTGAVVVIVSGVALVGLARAN